MTTLTPRSVLHTPPCQVRPAVALLGALVVAALVGPALVGPALAVAAGGSIKVASRPATSAARDVPVCRRPFEVGR